MEIPYPPIPANKKPRRGDGVRSVARWRPPLTPFHEGAMERKAQAGILASPTDRGYSCGTAPDWTGLPPLGAALPGDGRT
jgi:hypothetical protein